MPSSRGSFPMQGSALSLASPALAGEFFTIIAPLVQSESVSHSVVSDSFRLTLDCNPPGSSIRGIL